MTVTSNGNFILYMMVTHTAPGTCCVRDRKPRDNWKCVRVCDDMVIACALYYVCDIASALN